MKTRKPDWVKVRMPSGKQTERMYEMVEDLKLHTVCQEANCPNLGECFSNRTATFMIMGELCTRHCRFCSVKKGSPTQLDEKEPLHVANAVHSLMLRHAVITSVTRDDLSDNGASHFAETIRMIKQYNPDTTVEVLIPDMGGNKADLVTVLKANPKVMNHNIETVPRLYSAIRPDAEYERSLEVLKYSKKYYPNIITKSGIMVGLGEKEDEVIELMKHLVDVHCDVLTIGQYLQPTNRQVDVTEFVEPKQFDRYKSIGIGLGIPHVESGVFVRSSYNAVEALEALS